MLVNAALQTLGIRHEQVVADELQAIAEPLGELPPRIPVVLGGPVLDRHERELVREPRIELGHRGAVRLASLEAIRAVSKELARRGIERDRDPVAMSRTLGCLEHRLDRLLGRVEVGRESSLVPHSRREAAVVQHALQRVERLRADPQCFGERARAGRHDHELLEVDRVLRVRTAVDDVHHRHRKRARALAAQRAEERHASLRRDGLRDGERDAEDRVRAETSLVRRAVELDQPPVDGLLVGPIERAHRVGDLAVDVRDRARHRLPAIRVLAVAELDRLVHAGRGARRHGGPPERSRLEPHVHLERRVASRVEDLPGVDFADRRSHDRHLQLRD